MKSLRLFVTASAFAIAASSIAVGKTEIPNAAQPQLTVGADGRVWLVYAQTAVAPAAPAGGHDHHKAEPAEKSHDAKGHGKGGHGPEGRAGDVFVVSSKDGG